MNVEYWLHHLTLEEKAALCSGKDFWTTKGIERLGIPSWMMTDGPHGLRKQSSDPDHVGLHESVPATCFPSGVTLASTWDRDLLEEIGRALGEEARAEGVGVLLGPAVNIKRHPLGGRNFEYFSEDPYLAGELAKHHVRGVQSQGVGTSIKHFAANNQETHRNTIDTIVDERTLREIYLPAFERAIQEAHPWTVMAAYNKLNGIFCAEHPWLLQKVLREEWGFQGVVLTDWGACNDKIAGLIAGQDLEMPSSRGLTDAEVVAAVRSGVLDETVLDRACRRILELTAKVMATQKAASQSSAGFYSYDRDAHHELARRAAREGAVLLKNEGNLLPLSLHSSVAFIGAFARQPRYQGGGSSHITPTQLDTALVAAQKLKGLSILYADGYRLDQDDPEPGLIQEACEVAKQAEMVVLFIGLTDRYESEGYDRKDLSLPKSHVALLQAVCRVQQRIIVVLSNGAPVEMPWINQVPAVLETYLGGQGWGTAVVDLLFGRANPCGKLAETFPISIQDTPAYLNFPGNRRRVEYREGIFVGYRYYISVGRQVLFPFGHGLSYSHFEYSNLRVSKSQFSDNEELLVQVDVTNRGPLPGKEIVQLYVIPPQSTEVVRPKQELKGFAKLSLEVGETKTAQFSLNKRSFAYWSVDHHDWVVETGEYTLAVGASSVDLRLSAVVRCISTTSSVLLPLDMNSTIADLEGFPEAKEFVSRIRETFFKMFGSPDPDDPQALIITSFLEETPLRSIVRMVPTVNPIELNTLLEKINKTA